MSYMSDWLEALSKQRGRKITQEDAAELLGMSKRQFQVYCAGKSHHTGKVIDPSYAVACLMDQIISGKNPKPWQK